VRQEARMEFRMQDKILHEETKFVTRVNFVKFSFSGVYSATELIVAKEAHSFESWSLFFYKKKLKRTLEAMNIPLEPMIQSRRNSA
jgi:hypothetical protein